MLALVSTGFIGFGLWVHHMFATGIPELGSSFFTAASIMIAIPSGIQVFCWIATIWGGKVRLRSPMLFVLGFFAVFIIGGMTGVMITVGGSVSGPELSSTATLLLPDFAAARSILLSPLKSAAVML